MKFDVEFDKQSMIDELGRLISISEKIPLKDAERQFENWHNTALHFLKEAFTDNNVAAYFENEASMETSYSYIGDPPEVYAYDLAKARKALRLFLRELAVPVEVKKAVDASSKLSSSNVFVVHGHDEALREKVCSVLRILGLEPVVLNEKANQGMSILEKIEKHGDVGFAVVLFTSDDVGASKLDHTAAKYDERPRQNVLLELGYFWGKLGRNRVCLLNGVGDALASDLKGLGYVSTQGGDFWKLELARELKAAGYKVDANKLL